METIEHNKLVRDRILEIVEQTGDTYEAVTIENDNDFRLALLEKLLEEAAELTMATTREEFLAEYADLMVVLDVLTGQYDFSEAEVKLAIETNVEQKGLFEKRVWLQSTTQPTAEGEDLSDEV